MKNTVNSSKSTVWPFPRYLVWPIALILLTGIGIGIYFLVSAVFLKSTEVPSVIGLEEDDAVMRIEDAGLRCELNFSQEEKTGNEVVTKQSLKAGTGVDKGTNITLTMQDKDMADALEEAGKKLGEANTALAEVQGMGIDTTDLSQPLQSAQSKYDNAKNVEELIGPNDSSVFWSNYVINGCNGKKQAYETEKNQQTTRTYSDEEAAAADDAGWYGLDPEGWAPFYTVIITSLDQRTGHTKSEGAVLADELREHGFPGGVLDSNNFGSLRRPYWVVYSGMYDSEPSAQSACNRLKSAGYSEAYVRYVAIEGPHEEGPVIP